MENLTKVCTKCNQEKEFSMFYLRNKIHRSQCKSCWSLSNKSYTKLNGEKLKEYREKYKTLFPDKKKEYMREYRKQGNGIKTKGIRRNEKINLSRGYVTDKLKRNGFKYKDITPELIEVKRLLIKTKRLCKTSQI